MYIILFLVAFSMSTIGSVCGIGGGVIIKPALDALDIMDVSAISFLSSCTVLSMALVSVTSSLIQRKIRYGYGATPYIAVGAAAGGVIGKFFFQKLKTIFGNENGIGLVQSLLLGILMLLVFIYLRRSQSKGMKKQRAQGHCSCVAVGLILGACSAFLGIGGGPLNVAILVYFFAMDAKEAAANSLIIICFSQTASLLQILFSRSEIHFETPALLMMILGGVLGGTIGPNMRSYMKNEHVSVCMNVINLLVVGVCFYNAFRFVSAL